MIKNMGIFSRNFFKTLGILGTAIIIIHAIVYFTFPVFYAENQRNKINESANILIKYLEDKNSDKIPLLLESYSKNLRISVHLKEETPKDDSQIVKDLNINKNNESTYIIIEERTLKTKDNKNASVWQKQKYDLLVDEIYKMPKSAERDKKINEAEKILIDDAVIAPIYFAIENTYTNPKIHGLVRREITGITDFTYAYIK